MRRIAVSLLALIAIAAAGLVGFMVGSSNHEPPDSITRLCSFNRLNHEAWIDADDWTRTHPDAAHPASPPDVWTIGKQAALARAVRAVSIEDVEREWRAIPIVVSNLSLTMANVSDPDADLVSRVDQQDRFTAAEAACAGRS